MINIHILVMNEQINLKLMGIGPTGQCKLTEQNSNLHYSEKIVGVSPSNVSFCFVFENVR